MTIKSKTQLQHIQRAVSDYRAIEGEGRFNALKSEALGSAATIELDVMASRLVRDVKHAGTMTGRELMFELYCFIEEYDLWEWLKNSN